jgi:restriction endonuclease Mrr
VIFIVAAFLVRRHKRQEVEHQALYLSKRSPRAPIQARTPDFDPGPNCHNEGREVAAGSGFVKDDVEATFADNGLWNDRLAREKSDDAKRSTPPAAFDRALLDALEWRRFEQLVTGYFEKTGLEAKRAHVGADGGVDVKLYRKGEEKPFAYVQCKAWHVYTVGVKPVRELFGVMAADAIGAGYFVTTGTFTAEAKDFARNRDMKLMTGEYLLEELNSLPDLARSELLNQITRGDYRTPTCPRCDIKMVLRKGGDGEFWGCPNFSKRPSCRQTFKLRKTDSDLLNYLQDV